MHTNTTGGPTDRPVLHRRPEDAADQPTTEPSAEQSLSEIRENATSPNSHMTVEGFEEAMANLLAPAPQPAADTETEVQWGVRMDDGREIATGNEITARHWCGGMPGRTLLTRTATVTPWEEA